METSHFIYHPNKLIGFFVRLATFADNLPVILQEGITEHSQSMYMLASLLFLLNPFQASILSLVSCYIQKVYINHSFLSYLLFFIFYVKLFIYLFFEEQRISKNSVSGLIKVHIQMSCFPPYNSDYLCFQLLLQLWRPLSCICAFTVGVAEVI